jgi:hypothetical protein
MTINYPLHVQERFTRLLEQRAVQAKKAKGETLAAFAKLEHAESGPLSPASADVPRELPGRLSTC